VRHTSKKLPAASVRINAGAISSARTRVPGSACVIRGAHQMIMYDGAATAIADSTLSRRSSSCTRCTSDVTCGRMRLPSSLIVMPRVERTMSVNPSCSSRRATALLTCEGGMLSSRAAPFTD
jgi:hypothetical protein